MDWQKIEKIEHDELQFVLDFSDDENENKQEEQETKLYTQIPLNIKTELLVTHRLKINKNKNLCTSDLIYIKPVIYNYPINNNYFSNNK